MSSRLRSKKTRLRNLMTSFNGIYLLMEQYDPEQHWCELASRLEKLEPLWEQINEAMTETEMVDSEEGSSEERYVKERIEFQNKFFAVKAFLQNKLRECSDRNAALPQVLESSVITSSHPHPHVKLPMISLPKFSGNIEEWLAFRDLYVSLIHLSSDLPEIEKFHYLRSQLEGEALTLISSLAITQANYEVAWHLLVKRYSNSKLLKKKQVQKLFELHTVKRESVVELQRLVDGFEKATKVLDQVVEAANYKDLLLIHLLCSRLDDKTRRCWEEYSSSLEEESVKDIVEFLQRRVRILESLPCKQPESYPPMVRKVQSSKLASHSTIQTTPNKCFSCADSHPLYICPKFTRLSVSERENLLRQNSLCRNCFRKGHQARECSSKFSCRRCKQRHHTLVCYKPEDTHGNQQPNTSIESTVQGGSSNTEDHRIIQSHTNSVMVSSTINRKAKKVLLATAIVMVEDYFGNQFPGRALLDSGSECNIISAHLSQKLRVKRVKSNVQISGVGQVSASTSEKIQATVKSRLTDYRETMEFYVLSRVTEDLPTTTIDINCDLPVNLSSAFSHQSNGKSLGNHLPTLIDSVFGWVVTGRCGWDNGKSPIVCQHSTISESLERLMQRFWECENEGSQSNYSLEESQCEEYFLRTVKRGQDGRYTVGLPKATEKFARLGDTKVTAHRRLMLLERRLTRDNLKLEYHTFMSDYMERGHMRKVSETSVEPITTYYLPHHPVIKDSSTTIRDDLRSIIMRSRLFPIVLIAGIEKMFRQIWMASEDLSLQRVLWRFDPEQPVDVYELLTVTYGTKTAPFLATRTLKQLSIDEAANFPSVVAGILAKDVYMDDVITGV
ncbi:uncharacterized protein LOC129763416 [Toxorhynchites rutilus septentrionalis]|uniref:uncharacterized protein LOC129763416 n=1 Tax=Toxorhynchites rutilus septentrionalis TaxID=329112 RepID=UPI00247A3F35|nr:uncharacterized protein LOC129763416 [Toxorhynchites rutilus septentrionalis]